MGCQHTKPMQAEHTRRHSCDSNSESIQHKRNSLIQTPMRMDRVQVIVTPSSSFQHDGHIHDLHLTDFDHDVLLSTWPLLSKRKLNNGSHVLRSAFEIFPEAKNFFTFQDVPDDELDNDEDFQRIALAFMNTLEAVVEHSLDLKGPLYEDLLVLGARHALLPNFKTVYFKVFVRACQSTWESLLGEEYTEDVRRVWNLILEYIVSAMIKGCVVYEEEETNYPMNDVKTCGRPSVTSMTSEELERFHSHSK